MPARKTRPRRPAASREGVALVVVMLMVLMVTATATLAVRSSSTELRASGHARRAMQTGYVAESAVHAAFDWVDERGPRALVDVMHRRERGRPLDMHPFEPQLRGGKAAHRFYMADLRGAGRARATDELSMSTDVQPVVANVFGNRDVYEAVYAVDVYDLHVYTGVTPGYAVANGLRMRRVRATFTARTRARLRDSAGVGDEGTRVMHETAIDARGEAISGPFAM
jgi:hypothetical protein